MNDSNLPNAHLPAEVWGPQSAQALWFLHGKWKLKILALLCLEPLRLSELKRRIPGAPKKMLTDSLHSMESDGIVTRNDLGGPVRHVEYAIVEPMRDPTATLIGCLAEWAHLLQGTSTNTLPVEPSPQ